MIDIVIPYRIPPHGTHELQFALRSACEHYDVGRVFLLGDKPDWCTGVVHVPGGDEGRDPIWNVMQKLKRFVSAGGCPGEFVLWNDDMYVMRPLDLSARYDSDKTIGELAERLIGRYKQATLNTAAVTGPRYQSYELHRPTIMHPDTLWLALDRAGKEPMLFRTLYEWVEARGIVHHENDRLAITADDVDALIQGPWFASRDTMATAAEFVLPMRKRFPDKCRFEV